MRKIKFLSIFLALLLSLSLSGCGKESGEDPAWLMEFPGLQWGMTPEEACAALSLEEGDYEASTGSFYTIYGIRRAAFDVDGAYLSLAFQDNNSDGAYSLFFVQASYPHNADMEAVKAVMVRQYGEPAEDADARSSWESSATQQDIMSEEKAAFLSTYNDTTKNSLTNPVTAITWDTKCYPSFTLDGAESGNRVELNSSAGFYTREGGYKQTIDSMK